MKRLLAILTQRCPVCLTGPIFRSFLESHKHCPHCGVLYEREQGFYLNSMFIAYTLGFLIILPSAFYLFWIESTVPFFTVAIVLETLILWPLIFRYSRVIWMHMDQVMDPRSAEQVTEQSAPQT